MFYCWGLQGYGPKRGRWSMGGVRESTDDVSRRCVLQKKTRPKSPRPKFFGRRRRRRTNRFWQRSVGNWMTTKVMTQKHGLLPCTRASEDADKVMTSKRGGHMSMGAAETSQKMIGTTQEQFQRRLRIIVVRVVRQRHRMKMYCKQQQLLTCCR